MGRNFKIYLISFIYLIQTILIVFAIYVNITYEPDDTAKEVYEQNANSLVFGNEFQNDTLGFIIYPGGKVEPESYSPLAKKISDLGYLVVIAEFTFNLGILDSNVADDIISEYTNIDEWIIVGHSLGGTAASIYANDHDDVINSVVFLGSYAYKDLSDNNLKTITITGSNDLVLNRNSFNDSINNYPNGTEHFVIEGGNHAYYGNYGKQRGDGEALIGNSEQQDQVVNYIISALLSQL